MTEQRPAGCPQCTDPAGVVLTTEPVRRVDGRIAIFRCPGCGTLILDDVYGWKGSGVVFLATEAMIEEYIRDNPGGGLAYAGEQPRMAPMTRIGLKTPRG